MATTVGLTSQDVAAALQACSKARVEAVRKLAAAKTDAERLEAMGLLEAAAAAADRVGRAGAEFVPGGYLEARPQVPPRVVPEMPRDLELEAAVRAALGEEE